MIGIDNFLRKPFSLTRLIMEGAGLLLSSSVDNPALEPKRVAMLGRFPNAVQYLCSDG